MWWRILVALALTLPPVAYVAGELADDERHEERHPTVVLNTGETDRDATDRDERDRGDGKNEPRKRDRKGGEVRDDRDDRDDRPGGVTVVRPGPVAVGDDGGDDDHDDGDDDDGDTDDAGDDD